MANITISGASDDGVLISGNIREEFSLDLDGDGSMLVACSDGTLLRVGFSDSGVWRITPVVHGSAALTIAQAPEDDDSNYTDRAMLTGDIAWVVQGTAWASGKDAD